jgi:hypothetical protein
MAIVSVKTLHDGWTASITGKEIPTFNVVYLVEVDSPLDGNIRVLSASGIPVIGQSYSAGNDFYATSTCKSVSSSPVAGTRNLWQVTASYGKPEKEDEDDDPSQGTTQDGEPTEDPLKFAVSMSMSSTRVTRDCIYGTYLGQYEDGNFDPNKSFNNGNPPTHANVQSTGGKITNGRAITNSVWTPFDPPVQTEYNRTNVKIRFNTLNSPQRIIPYVNSVNSKNLTINLSYRWADEWGQDRGSFGRVYIPAYTGRLMGISTNPASRGGIGYHENEIEIEIDKLFGWRLDVLDRGYATLDTQATFGGSSTAGSTPKTNAVATEDGFASRDPVLLDGEGQALDILQREAVYLRYGVYPEMDWKQVDLHEPKRLQGAN